MILGEEEKPSLDELAHHGVKGMKWGVRKAEITSARDRHFDRMDRLNHEAVRLSFAKSTAEKQKILNGIHTIANEKGADQDATTAFHMTRGEKIGSTIVSGGLMTLAAHMGAKKQSEEDRNLLKTYRHSKISDYHNANK
jgi:hypothetical protein